MTIGNLLGRIVTSRLGHTVSTLVPSTTIWEREWDVCCVLDGCRYDLMADVATAGHELLPPPEGLESLWSAGSQSAEWMDNTFASTYDSEMQNTAYVTGNPFTAQSCDHIVVTSGEVLPLSGDEFGLLYEAWRDEWVDGDISTIPPGPLTDAAISIWNHREEFDVDRVLVHYMQPHAPYRSRPEWFLGTADRGGWGRVDGESEDADLTDLSPEEIRALEELAAAETDGMKDPWTRLRDGDLPRDEFWAAYRDNLRWVLDDVTRLFENCDGRIALTSDHGNGAGEYGVWSHPPGTPVPSLRRVPWVVRRGTNESTCTPELPDGVARERSPDDAGDEVEGRLAALGYR